MYVFVVINKMLIHLQELPTKFIIFAVTYILSIDGVETYNYWPSGVGNHWHRLKATV